MALKDHFGHSRPFWDFSKHNWLIRLVILDLLCGRLPSIIILTNVEVSSIAFVCCKVHTNNIIYSFHNCLKEKMNVFDYAKQVCSCESPFVDVSVVTLFIGAIAQTFNSRRPIKHRKGVTYGSQPKVTSFWWVMDWMGSFRTTRKFMFCVIP
jgi:hypothetical protein